MDAADIATIHDWFSTHSRFSFKMPDSTGECTEQALRAAVDVPRINREVVAYMIAQLGDSANEWQYILQFNDHIGVFHPDKDFKQAKGLINNLELEAKAQLGLEGHSILEPMDEESYNEELEELTKSDSGNKQPCATRRGHLPDVLDQIDRMCDCWIPIYVFHALHRSGNFLKPNATRRKSIDLDLWRWSLPAHQ